MTEPEKEPLSVEQTREEIEALLAVAVDKLGDVVNSGGKETTKSLQCPNCARWSEHKIKIADPKDLVSIVSTLSQAAPRLKSKDDAATARAIKMQADLSELSNSELAERIARLEELIADGDGQTEG